MAAPSSASASPSRSPSPFLDHLGGYCDGLSDACTAIFPCLSDPVTRASICVKLALVLFHVVAVGVLFLLDGALVEKTRKEPWYTAVFLFLFVVTLIQYFITSGSSPGYIDEAMRSGSLTRQGSPISWGVSKQSTSRENGRLLGSSEYDQGRNRIGQTTTASLSALMTELYAHGPSRNLTCSYCKSLQPPRAKHCHDCERCVLQFDHHCIWLGTCIGQKNHSRFWWYIFDETILCIWTIIMYISYLEQKVQLSWWKETAAIIIIVLLIFSLVFLLLLLFFHSYLLLTNQTTFELVRRRRIPYMREIPENVHPFSRGICGNLRYFCCSFGSGYELEAVPTIEEVQARARPYACVDIISCRCC